MLGTSTISNQSLEGSIKYIAVNVSLTDKPLTSSMLVVTEYGPIRYMSTYAHGSTSTILDGILPYLRLSYFLNFRQVLHLLTLCSACVTNLGQL